MTSLYDLYLQRGDSGMKKMQDISMIENAMGIANGILLDACEFDPFIWDAPRLIHDSSVYPNLPKQGQKSRIKSFEEGLRLTL